MTVKETAELFAKSGLNCCELCFCQSDLSGWKYNYSGYGALPSAEDILRAVETFTSYGIKVLSIGVYNCLWQGTAESISASLEYFGEYCDIASDNGIKMLSTHSGTADARLGIGKIPKDNDERVTECFMYALLEAYKRGLTLALECGEFDVIKSYDEFSVLKREAKKNLGTSEMLKYIGVSCCGNEQIKADELAFFHLKDKSRDGRFYECFGNGNSDCSLFFDSLNSYNNPPLILEYVNSSTLSQVVGKVPR